MQLEMKRFAVSDYSGSSLKSGSPMASHPDERVVDAEDLPLLAHPEVEDASRRGTTSYRTNVIILTLCGGIGGFLFGYDTGVISGALPYIRDDLLVDYVHDKSRLNWIQEVIVSAAIVGAGFGSAIGGWVSDRIGRRSALFIGDALFTAGAMLMGLAWSPSVLIAGRLLVGLGIGLASVTVPVYIAECAPPSSRATLVSANVLMITTGQFLAYAVDYLFTFVPGTWRWMLGVAAVPSVLQAVALLFLPESPRWLAGHGSMAAAKQVMTKLRPPETLAEDLRELQQEADNSSGGLHQRVSLWQLLRSAEVRAEAALGLGLQVLQQLAGINTVMYYTPAILELAGFHDKRTALLLAMIPAGVNAVGTVVGMWYIDRAGRRRLLLGSLAGVIAALCLLGGAFYMSDVASSAVLPQGSGSTCPLPSGSGVNCAACLRHGCGFCGEGNPAHELDPGTCLAVPDLGQCQPPAGVLYRNGCPSQYTAAIILGLVLYLAAFSPGLGPVPWAVNAEIYPLQLRGLMGGAAATANWITNAVVSQTFLTLTEVLGAGVTFWLIGGIALAGAVWVYMKLPETQGLSLEQVQQLFAERVRQAKRTSTGNDYRAVAQ